MIHSESLAETLAFSEATAPVQVGVAADALAFREAVGVAATRASEVEHWPRWVVASVAKHVDDRRRGLPMFLEGEDHLEGLPEWIEVRVDGPYVREPSRGFYHVELEVNVLIATSKDDVDLYRHLRNVGTVLQALLAGPIAVCRFGAGIDDDQSLLGCAVLVRNDDQREALRTSHFGQLDAITPLLRSSVEGHYLMQLH